MKGENMETKKVGAPKKEIDQEQFEKLCALQCTEEEICSWFDCCHDTLEKWCKETFDESFSQSFKKYSRKGKISLRRYQFRLAEKNPSMAIFLGKQYLGQSDYVVSDDDKKVLVMLGKNEAKQRKDEVDKELKDDD